MAGLMINFNKSEIVIVRYMGQGTCTAHIYDHHQAIGPAAVEEEAHKGWRDQLMWRSRQAKAGVPGR